MRWRGAEQNGRSALFEASVHCPSNGPATMLKANNTTGPSFALIARGANKFTRRIKIVMSRRLGPIQKGEYASAKSYRKTKNSFYSRH